MEEIWKDIPGFEGYYQASTLGNIRSVDRCLRYVKHYVDKNIEATHHFKGKLLSPSFSSGYLSVILSVDGVQIDKLVHRLVATTFLPKGLNADEVDHIDGDRTNNVVDNLRWVSSKENHQYSLQRGSHTSLKPYNSRAIPVVELETGRSFVSMHAAETYYGLAKGSVSSAILSNQRVHGHRFRKMCDVER